jgi:hypothetical protein
VNQWINFSALAKIVIGGLICGAGLPALFALGLRALHMGAPAAVPALAGAGAGQGTSSTEQASAEGDDDRLAGGSRLGMVLAGICFLVVLGAVVWGIYLIVAA